MLNLFTSEMQETKVAIFHKIKGHTFTYKTTSKPSLNWACARFMPGQK